MRSSWQTRGRSRPATGACLYYLERVIAALRQHPLLKDFGRSLDEDGLRRPLRVAPCDVTRFRERMVHIGGGCQRQAE
jgi:hypothetical protein